MNKVIKFITTLFTTVILAGVLIGNVYAENVINLTCDKESCEIGDKVSITVKIETDGDSAIPPQVNIVYNPSRLSFENCSTEYGGGGGGLITVNDTETVVDFTTLSGGTATLNVTAVVGDDSTEISQVIDVNVNGEDTAVESDIALASSEFDVEENSISTADGRMVQSVFPEEYMPILFHKATTQYQNQTVECAQFDMGDMSLLYTTDGSGNDGRFSIYNVMTAELSDFRMIQGIENRFVIILNECDEAIPSGYTKAVLDWNGQTLTAYMNPDMPSDFFLIYGLSSEGVKGWYQYDQKEGTYQRFAASSSMQMGEQNTGSLGVNDGNGDQEETFLDDYLSRKAQMIILLTLAGLVFVLLIIVLILAFKCSEYNDYEYIDPDEYYAQEKQFAPQDKKATVKASTIVSRSLNDEEEPDLAAQTATASDEANDEEDNSRDDVREENIGSEDEIRDSYPQDDQDDMIESENVDDYFDPHMSRRELRDLAKQRKRDEKEAAREEKWRQKEEKKAAKMRAKGYEEAMPMDWSTFGESREAQSDDRRPFGTGKLPAYMQQTDDAAKEVEASEESATDQQADPNAYGGGQVEFVKKQPASARKRPNATMSVEDEEETAKARKEDELRKKQKRLFEQQQIIEEQRRIEQEQYEEQQRLEQERYVLAQQHKEDLDEDFQFEFIDI